MDSSADLGWAIVRAQAGDRDALETVLVAARAVASGVARRIALDAADDVVQEVLWIVARKLPWLDEPDAFVLHYLDEIPLERVAARRGCLRNRRQPAHTARPARRGAAPASVSIESGVPWTDSSQGSCSL